MDSIKGFSERNFTECLTDKKDNSLDSDIEKLNRELYSDMFRKDPDAKPQFNLKEKLFNAVFVRVPTTTEILSEEEINKVANMVQPGDILLFHDATIPFLQFIEKTVANSSFTHAAIYEGEGRFIEATMGGIGRTDLREDLKNQRKNIEIIRPKYKTPEDREAALNYVRSQLGKPYDIEFKLKDDNMLYCSELVQRALEEMPNPMSVPKETFLGKEYVGPDAFRNLPEAETVYSNNFTFLKANVSHYPVYAVAIAGMVAGGMTLCTVGAVAGFVGGGAMAILLGNKIQTGQFSFFPTSTTSSSKADASRRFNWDYNRPFDFINDANKIYEGINREDLPQ